MGDVTDQASRIASATTIPTTRIGRPTASFTLSQYRELGLAPALRDALGVPGGAPGGSGAPSGGSIATYSGGERFVHPQATQEIVITASSSKGTEPSTEVLAAAAAGSLLLGGVLAAVARRML